MQKFIFKAKKPSGEIYSEKMEAEDRFEMYNLIKNRGEEVVSVEEIKTAKGLNMNIEISFLKKIKVPEKIAFARNLGAMLEAGLSLTKAISVIERQSKNTKLRNILNDISVEINRGVTFSKALEKHKKVFPPVFISMVHAGEQGGTLPEALKSIAMQMDSNYKLEKRIKGAMTYPAVIVAVMIIVGVLMFIFVVPSLMQTFLELNVELPASTKFVLLISNIVRDHGLVALIVVIALFIGIRFWSKQASGKLIIHEVILRIPLIGELAKEVNSARTARTLSSLLSSGVAVMESLDITAEVIQNVHFRKVLSKAKETIQKGNQMSGVFAENTKYYPIFFAEMMNVGEETGRVSEMLTNVARFYEDDVEQRTKDMSTVIEPFLIVFIGAAVGFFAISMISPMYSLVSVI
jgi:type IV pilus assembly protein PilC